MTTHVVVGLNFGDEGKGTLTNYLCKKSIEDRHKLPLVIRYSGGHQAGHTIEDRDGVRHVFQSFGSGTLRNVPTFWSKYCVMFPIGFVRELKDLQALKVDPVIYFDPEVAVTTIYDVLYNQAIEQARGSRHGSVGVGIGATYERQETPYKLFFKDLYYPTVLAHKLKQIRDYYLNKIYEISDHINFKGVIHTYNKNDFASAHDNFMKAVKIIVNNDNVSVASEAEMFSDSGRDYIFEGAQGILLDQTHGFFPNVTRCNVTCQNAMEIIKRHWVLFDNDVHIDYITRTYMTRHGVGIFPTEGSSSHLIDDLTDKTNVTNDWQQKFRYGCLDFELIKYALECDKLYHTFDVTKTMNISCMDQLKNENQIFISGTDGYKIVDFLGLLEEFNEIGNFYYNFRASKSPFSEFYEFNQFSEKNVKFL